MDEKRILIVEDEIKIANSLKKGLEENGFYANVAYDGTIGKKLFFASNYDLLVLDINLPGINGFQLCHDIRRSNSHVPIIMLTALNTTDDKVEGFNAGADDYLIKPFEFKELLLRIRALLKRASNQQIPTGNFYPLQISP